MKKIVSVILLLLVVTLDVAAQQVVEATDTIETTQSKLDTIYNAVDSVATADSTGILLGEKVKPRKAGHDWDTWRPDIKRAMWLALVIPGAGQIYNRKFWKLPIIYGGIMGCIYAWSWNGTMYNDYAQAYQDIMDDDPTTKSYEKFMHGVKVDTTNESRYQTLFKNRKDRFRRWRDLSIFCLIGVYAISVIDAYVDASLSEFDISDDLSLKVAPTYLNNSGGQMMASHSYSLTNGGLGVRCQLRF